MLRISATLSHKGKGCTAYAVTNYFIHPRAKKKRRPKPP
jgi:hypothetical protein